MNKIEIEGIDNIRKIEFDLLKKFHAFCEENNLKYVLTQGTLLGAVRHGGFIPWDDDIDVAMFRPDYEKLISLADKMPQDCKFIFFENTENFSRLYGRVVSTNYISVDDYYSKKYSNYFGIDVFPIEAVPKNSKNYFKKLKILRQMFIFANSAIFKGINKLKAYIIKPLPILLCKIIGRKNIYKMFYKTVKKVDFNTAENLAIVTGVYNYKELFTKQEYYDIININFNGFKTKSIKNYDKYLKNLYGNYLDLPKPEDQIPHHNFKLYKIPEE